MSEISGRGVGLDAVKRNLEDIGGKVSLEILEYTDGAGVCVFQFVLSLPKDFWVDINENTGLIA